MWISILLPLLPFWYFNLDYFATYNLPPHKACISIKIWGDSLAELKHENISACQHFWMNETLLSKHLPKASLTLRGEELMVMVMPAQKQWPADCSKNVLKEEVPLPKTCQYYVSLIWLFKVNLRCPVYEVRNIVENQTSMNAIFAETVEIWKT